MVFFQLQKYSLIEEIFFNWRKIPWIEEILFSLKKYSSIKESELIAKDILLITEILITSWNTL